MRLLPLVKGSGAERSSGPSGGGSTGEISGYRPRIAVSLPLRASASRLASKGECMKASRVLTLSTIAAVALLAAGNAAAKTYDLPATPTTVAWGHYDATAKPVLTVQSGDVVVVHTLLTNSPTGLEKAGVAPADVEKSLRAVFDGVPQSERGPGGHILTGPVFIEGAEPGDTLEVRILKIDLAIPYAYNGFRYGAGILSDDFPYARTRIIPLDRTRMVANFAPGVTIPLRPFFGSMGVAPPPAVGRYDSTPPTFIGGNMDNKELTVGTTLYLPVYVKGALFEVGDGHAGQGN